MCGGFIESRVWSLESRVEIQSSDSRLRTLDLLWTSGIQRFVDCGAQACRSYLVERNLVAVKKNRRRRFDSQRMSTPPVEKDSRLDDIVSLILLKALHIHA